MERIHLFGIYLVAGLIVVVFSHLRKELTNDMLGPLRADPNGMMARSSGGGLAYAQGMGIALLLFAVAGMAIGWPGVFLHDGISWCLRRRKNG